MQRLGRSVLVVLGLFLLFNAHPDAHQKAIQLIVSPHVANAPATVRLDLRIIPSATDRMLEVTTDSGKFFRQSAWSLQNGADGQRLFTVIWPDLPAGHYDIHVRLTRTNGVATAADSMTIEGR
ncbi:MAG TPA: hypothetical protein VNE16_15860 [Vicinamibacterales bacterium]|nr:hypothetical protein [Vicinamibacterales bacterium]